MPQPHRLENLTCRCNTRWVLAGSTDSKTRLFSLAGGNPIECIREWLSPQNPIRSDEGPLMQFGGILNPNRGDNPVVSVALSPDETLAASGTRTGVVQIVDIPSATVRQELGDHKSSAQSVAFSPNGLYLATGYKDHTVRVWRRAGAVFSELVSLPATGPVVKVEFSPDGKQLGILVKGEHAVR